MSRIFNFVFIFYCFEVGIFLVLLPWFNIWENNALLHRYPIIKTITLNGYIKGMVIGLGVANILMGISEVMEIRRKQQDAYFHR